MSPRSAEFVQAGKERLEVARSSVRTPASAISLAYYAMLYAARAGLSERDAYAKTHAGTWNLFQQQFVDHGDFDPRLLTELRNVQRERENADYEAWPASREEAERVVEIAGRFLTAVEHLIAETEEG